MFKAVGIWTWPQLEDQQEFDEHYLNTHVVLATKLPGARRITLLRADDSARDAGIYRVAEVYWDGDEAFTAASESPEWAAMVEDATWMMGRFGIELTSVTGWETAPE